MHWDLALSVVLQQKNTSEWKDTLSAHWVWVWLFIVIVWESQCKGHLFFTTLPWITNHCGLKSLKSLGHFFCSCLILACKYLSSVYFVSVVLNGVLHRLKSESLVSSLTRLTLFHGIDACKWPLLKDPLILHENSLLHRNIHLVTLEYIFVMG